MQPNSFLDPSFDIRWSRLTPEHIAPAIEAALTQAEAAIAAIGAQPLAAVTYASTFLALENATEALNIAWAKVGHLQSVADTPRSGRRTTRCCPRSARFTPGSRSIRRWSRLKAGAARPEVVALTGVHRRFCDETLADFRQAGADLPAAARQRLEAIQSELAQVTQKYSENVLDATTPSSSLSPTKAGSAGSPRTPRPPHAAAPRRRGWVRPSGLPGVLLCTSPRRNRS